MTPLSHQSCIACDKNSRPMTGMEAREQMQHLPQWKMGEDEKSVSRRFAFKNFRQAMAFVNHVGELAERNGHHPDMHFGWGYAEITYTTHSIGGLHQNDFIMAAKTDEI